MRSIVESEQHSKSLLFLKPDGMSGQNWFEFAQSIGLETNNIEQLLSEISVAGANVLFIDGVDRASEGAQEILLNIIQTIIESEFLNDWKIVATVRDQGLESVRNWFPYELFHDAGLGVVEVPPLDDDEATELSNSVPSLHNLLFRTDKVREIIRRPFFASVIAQHLTRDTTGGIATPSSEIELIEQWWSRGGYDSLRTSARMRQAALIELAGKGAKSLGNNINQHELSANTVRILQDLIDDGILHDKQAGHTLKFTHNIFFEWCFLNLLISKGNLWIEEIVRAGEIPMLGRCVELLSQQYFTSNNNWAEQYTSICASDTRPQWARSWLFGPFGSTAFSDNCSILEDVVFADDYKFLEKLLVCFQAEKTIPNSRILSNSSFSTEHAKYKVYHMADILGWPSDLQMWTRLLIWLIDRIDAIPVKLIPYVVTLFEVWQNMFSAIENDVSNQILPRCAQWLDEIEGVQHPENFSSNRGRWCDLDSGSLNRLESALRTIILLKAQSYPNLIEAYLKKISVNKKFLHHSFSDVMASAPMLAPMFPELLSDICKNKILKELPKDLKKRLHEQSRQRNERLSELRNKPRSELSRSEKSALDSPPIPRIHSFSYHDWEELSILEEYKDFYPASPMREPFASLFNSNPKVAISLVRDMTNHAITSWRQLHDLDYRRQGTPIPITLSFPWGVQEFWGNAREYLWFRGWWGPEAIRCGFMALESWAFDEMEKGADIDNLIRQVVEGQDSIGVLGIAITIALHKRHVSEVTLPLISCQRLWRADLQRCAHEYSNSQSSLIGFQNATGLPHIRRLELSNRRPVRRQELRSLTPFFVLGGDNHIQAKACAAIQNFPNELPFEYEDERSSEDIKGELLLIAENWAQWGCPKNYKSFPHAEDESVRLVQLENPKATEPQALEAQSRHEATVTETSLWFWAEKTFINGPSTENMSITEAIDTAMQLDSDTIFQERLPDGMSDMKLGGLAATAAVAIRYRDDVDESKLKWAKDVIRRACDTPENQQGWSAESRIPWHPCIPVTWALGHEVKNASDAYVAKKRLLGLICHPLEIVSEAALKEVFSCWEVDQQFTWSALVLGMHLSARPVKHDQEQDRVFEPRRMSKHHQQLLSNFLTSFSQESDFMDIPSPPPAWNPLFDANNNNQIQPEPDIFFHWSFALKVLDIIPIEKFMSHPALKKKLLVLGEQLLHWTLERLSPPWEDRFGSRSSNLVQWCSHLSSFFAKMSVFLDPHEVEELFLSKISNLEDDVCLSFLSTFSGVFTCLSVLDADEVTDNYFTVIDQCLERTLQDKTFEKSSYRSGRFTGRDLGAMIQIFFFVKVENANEATRFANGNWKEINLVMPVIDKFISKAGWLPDVVSGYLTLCERSVEHFPPDKFAAHILSILQSDEEIQTVWRHTDIPARIAGLIQSFTNSVEKLDQNLARNFLYILDALVDMGDRRSAALQMSAVFLNIKS